MLFSSVSWLNIIFLTSLFILTIFRCIILHKWYNSFFFFFMATDWYASNLILWSLNVNNLKKHMFWSRELLIKMQLVQTEFTREFKKKRFFSYNELKTNYFLKFWNVFEKEGRSQDEDITICQVKSAKVHKKSAQLFLSLVFFFLVGLEVGILLSSLLEMCFSTKNRVWREIHLVEWKRYT